MDQSSLSGGRPDASRCSGMADGTSQAALGAVVGAAPATCATPRCASKPLTDMSREGLSFVTGSGCAPDTGTDAGAEVDVLQLRGSLLAIKVIADGAASNLRELRGCEIDPRDMLSVFRVLEDEAETALGCLPEFPVGDEPDGDAHFAAAQHAQAVKVVAQGVAANLREFLGCQIDRADMLAVLAVIGHSGRIGATILTSRAEAAERELQNA